MVDYLFKRRLVKKSEVSLWNRIYSFELTFLINRHRHEGTCAKGFAGRWSHSPSQNNQPPGGQFRHQHHFHRHRATLLHEKGQWGRWGLQVPEACRRMQLQGSSTSLGLIRRSGANLTSLLRIQGNQGTEEEVIFSPERRNDCLSPEIRVRCGHY